MVDINIKLTKEHLEALNLLFREFSMATTYKLVEDLGLELDVDTTDKAIYRLYYQLDDIVEGMK